MLTQKKVVTAILSLSKKQPCETVFFYREIVSELELGGYPPNEKENEIKEMCKTLKRSSIFLGSDYISVNREFLESDYGKFAKE